jgi:hypothetical protein
VRAELEQQAELLRVELVVVVEVVAEQGKGLDERPAAGHDLRPAAGDQIELGELLEHAHRILGGEHGDGAGEPDPLGAGGDRRQRHGRRRDEEVGAMVLADGEQVEPEPIGEHGLLQQAAHPLLGRDAGGEIGEGGETELHHASESSS